MSKVGYHIARVQQADWQRLRSVRMRALADTPDAFGTTLAEDSARADEQWQARAADGKVAQFLAMTDDDDCVGMAVGAPFRGEENTAGLFGMWVAPEARGHRIGTALVEAVVQWARDERYQRILLHVGDANVAAIALYEACGFLANGKIGTLPPPREYITEHERELNLDPK